MFTVDQVQFGHTVCPDRLSLRFSIGCTWLLTLCFHWIFFQDIYSKLVMLALALCALRTTAMLSWENRTEAEALWLALIAQTLIHMVFSLNFFQDIYSKLVMLALCAFHMTASCENRTEAEALWLALIAQTLIHMVFSLNFFQDIYSKLVMLALCAFHMTASCENLTETEALWLALIAQTLIHMVFSLNFFQDIYSKLVMLAVALWAFHTIASCENLTETEALWLALIAQTLIHINSLNFLPGHLQQVGDAGCGSVRSSHDSIVGKSHWGGGALHRLWFTCYKLLCSFSRTVDTHTHISYTFWLAMSCELLAQNKMLQTCPIINASKWKKGFPQNQNQTQWFGHHWTIKMMFKHHQTFEHNQNHSGLQKHQHHAVVYHYKSSWCSISATSQANQKVQSKWDLSISQVDQRSSEYPLVNSVNERDLNLLNTYM